MAARKAQLDRLRRAAAAAAAVPLPTTNDADLEEKQDKQDKPIGGTAAPPKRALNILPKFSLTRPRSQPGKARDVTPKGEKEKEKEKEKEVSNKEKDKSSGTAGCPPSPVPTLKNEEGLPEPALEGMAASAPIIGGSERRAMVTASAVPPAFLRTVSAGNVGASSSGAQPAGTATSAAGTKRTPKFKSSPLVIRTASTHTAKSDGARTPAAPAEPDTKDDTASLCRPDKGTSTAPTPEGD
jgi:hypothetical protein